MLRMLSYYYHLSVNALRLVLIGVVSFGVPFPILADAIPKVVMQAVSDLEADSIEVTPVPNLYLLSFGAQVAYVSGDGRYLLIGDLIEVESGINLAEDKRNTLREDIMRGLDESSMVIFSPVEVRSSITIFTDISCPYCVQLHQEINDLMEAGIQVRYAGYPRAGIPSAAHDILVSVWCADDPQKAITNAKAGRDIESKTCDTSIDKHMETAKQISVRGTPTIVLENGEIIHGYIPADQLVFRTNAALD